MADIYEGTLITIATVCSDDSNQGLNPLTDDFKPRLVKGSNFYIRKHVCENTDEASVF